MQNNNNSKNGGLIIILLLVVTVLVLFFPKIYDLISSFSLPKVEETEEEIKEEKKALSEGDLEALQYPLMRTSVYNSNSYYELDKFTIKDLSNNDILLNAFLNIAEGNITAYDGLETCTNAPKQFSATKLERRIKNTLSKNINYTLSNFYVPEDLDSNYTGNWNYDSYNGRYIYSGLCESKDSSVRYYNLEEQIKAEYNNDDIEVYYYVGFAKVENGNYIIYKDAKMTVEIKKGDFVSLENLNTVFKSLNKNDKNIYKYIFKNTLCMYSDEYCLYEGKWVNEL